MKQLSGDRPLGVQSIGNVLAHRKLLIAVVFVAVFGATAAVTFMLPPRYESRVKFLVKNERADMIVSPDANGGFIHPSEVSETRINSEVELLSSLDLLRQVVLDSGLNRTESSGAGRASSSDMVIEKALRRLQLDMAIAPVRKANIIQVTYSSTDAHLAAIVLQRLSERYLEAHIKVHSSPGTVEFFTQQAAHYQQMLKDAEIKLSQFRGRENIVLLEQQKTTLLQKASESESSLLQAEAFIREHGDKLADIQRQLKSTETRIVTESRTVPNQYSVERLHTMLAELRNRRTQLLAKFRPDDRSILEVEQEIADTDAALAKATQLSGLEQTSDVNPVHRTLQIELAKEQSELAGMAARRQILVGQGRRYREQLFRLGSATSSDEELVRNRKEAEEGYFLYAKRAAEAKVAESLDRQKIANVAVVEAPIESYLPSKPNVPLNLAVGFVLALACSLGGAFLAEYLRDTVVDQHELEAITGLPVLASVTIPHLLPAPALENRER